jgi:ornithine--oxo-acid transaminase
VGALLLTKNTPQFAAITLSSDPESRDNYGPYLPGIGCVDPDTGKAIRYNNVEDLRLVLEKHGENTAAFLVEPIQGEAGIVVPDDNYLREVKALCEKHNVLLICDEIQTGIARTGRLLCCEWSGIKPDMVLLGKAISGGMYPVSCVLSSKEIMLTVEPGTHGSTYGGNPLGSAVAIRALEIVQEENMVANAERLGEIFREGLRRIKNPMLKLVRGKGLLNAIIIDEAFTGGRSAWELCLVMKEKGLLAKPTHQNIIRLAPPLVITEEQIRSALTIIEESMNELPNIKGDLEAKAGAH